ncbi:MAG: vancomycin high temperature exclusion protein [Flavipsychrobacter sp.]|jgi:SanA protein|nr:vancomycin high temperature exclusion protein [Flavipsychrobacter sp.]
MDCLCVRNRPGISAGAVVFDTFENMRGFKRLFIVTVLVILLVFLALEFGLSYVTRDTLYTDIASIPRNKTALLLTTTKTDTTKGELLPYYLHRVQAAADLYHAGKVSYVLVSGANLAEPTVFLAREDLRAFGVPAERILLDTCGVNTYQSIVRCLALYDRDSMTIISQQHHCERAVYMAQQQGLDALGYIARGDGEDFRPGVILHEFMGRVKMLWRLRTNEQAGHLQDCPIYN